MKKTITWSLLLLLGMLHGPAQADQFPNPTGLTGLWFDPNSDGEGFNVLVTDTHLLVTYYGYADNQQRWLISVPMDLSLLQIGQLSAPLDMVAATAGTFSEPVPPDQVEVFGRLQMKFESCSSATFELSTIDGDKQSQLIKLAGDSQNDCLEPTLPCATEHNTTFDIVDGLVNDTTRARELAYRMYFPTNYSGCSPLILVSHGGLGNSVGHTSLAHLGSEFAAHGYVAIHINHRPSTPGNGLDAVEAQLLDRPTDVSFFIDALSDGRIQTPTIFTGQLMLDRIGHIGHSLGAYTSHAVAGAITEQGAFIDPRVRAIVPLSPQGAGVFGFFGHQERNNSWRSLVLPSLVMVGSEEIDSRPSLGFIESGWRLQPFANYPNNGDKWQLVLTDQDHENLASLGSPQVQNFIATNARRFFDTYLRGIEKAACEVGTLNPVSLDAFSKKIDPLGSLINCSE